MRVIRFHPVPFQLIFEPENETASAHPVPEEVRTKWMSAPSGRIRSAVW